MSENEVVNEQNQDTDKLEFAIEELKEFGVLVKLAFADGKIDWKDGKYGLKLFNNIPDYVKIFKAIDEMVDESKDLDEGELIKIGGAVVNLILAIKNTKE